VHRLQFNRFDSHNGLSNLGIHEFSFARVKQHDISEHYLQRWGNVKLNVRDQESDLLKCPEVAL